MGEGNGQEWKGVERLADKLRKMSGKWGSALTSDVIDKELRAFLTLELCPLLEAAEAKLNCKFRSPKMRQKVNEALQKELATWR